MKISAPAKLNLFLHITGRRDDHYHLLDSLFVFTQFGDEIQINTSKELSLTIDGPFYSLLKNESIENNLVYRAALLLKNKYAIAQGAKIILTKNIPINAGLGGGSSDAAAVLKGLNQLWDLNLSMEALCEIGLSLGADIPACINAQPAIISGIGEIIDPFLLPFPIPVLLVNPNLSLSTPAVFTAYKNSAQPFSSVCANQKISASNWPSLLNLLSQCRNDLEPAAIQLQPTIQSILNLLKQQSQCALARMSGSGSTCFALFSDSISAQLAAKKLKEKYPAYWIQASEIQCST